MKRVAAVLAVAAIGLVACNEATAETELTGYDGTSVEQGIEYFEYGVTEAMGSIAAACSLIDQVGYSEARSDYLVAEPQVGTDEYEGAVFDGFYAENC